MRKELQKIAGLRQRFTARFVRFGSKPAYKGAPIVTLLFEDVKDKYGKEYTDHIWFINNKGFKQLNLQPGEQISFDARVKPYIKGYRGKKEYDEDSYDPKPLSKEYKLSHPNNIIKHEAAKPGLLF